MSTLSVLLLLAVPNFAAPVDSSTPVVQAPTPPKGSLDSSKIRLDAHDAAGALADAEAALKSGGGADAYAARGDAKRALGRPADEAIADYAEAARLDPRYIEKYQGLVAQQESELHPQKSSGNKGLNGVPMIGIGMAALAGLFLFGAAATIVRAQGNQPHAPDDENVHPDGKVHPATGSPDDPDKPVKPDAQA